MPTAHRPDQNRHRLADGWQGSTVRSILENPRYAGYAVFGRWSKHEVLLDPDDVAAGHVVRFRRSQPERVGRSRRRDVLGWAADHNALILPAHFGGRGDVAVDRKGSRFRIR